MDLLTVLLGITSPLSTSSTSSAQTTTTALAPVRPGSTIYVKITDQGNQPYPHVTVRYMSVVKSSQTILGETIVVIKKGGAIFPDMLEEEQGREWDKEEGETQLSPDYIFTVLMLMRAIRAFRKGVSASSSTVTFHLSIETIVCGISEYGADEFVPIFEAVESTSQLSGHAIINAASYAVGPHCITHYDWDMFNETMTTTTPTTSHQHRPMIITAHSSHHQYLKPNPSAPCVLMISPSHKHSQQGLFEMFKDQQKPPMFCSLAVSDALRLVPFITSSMAKVVRNSRSDDFRLECVRMLQLDNDVVVAGTEHSHTHHQIEDAIKTTLTRTFMDMDYKKTTTKQGTAPTQPQ